MLTKSYHGYAHHGMKNSIHVPILNMCIYTPLFSLSHLSLHVHVFGLGFRWQETRRNVRIELSADKLEASLSKGDQWATFSGTMYYVYIICTLLL